MRERDSRIKVDGEWKETKALIIASGASARYLGLDREKGTRRPRTDILRDLRRRLLPQRAGLRGRRRRFQPAEEANFLTRFASKVYLIHRRDSLRASKIMADRTLANPKVEPVWNSAVTEYLTDEAGEVRAVNLKNLVTGEESELEVKCVFVAIGHEPNTAPFRGKLDTDENGYLIQTKGTHTNLEGVFAAGDVADHVYRQAITAAGQGCASAIDAERWLSEQE